MRILRYRQAQWQLDDLLQEPPAQRRPLAWDAALLERRHKILVGRLDVGGDKSRLHREDENAIRELPRQKEVDRLDHLSDCPWGTPVQVVHEDNERAALRRHQLEDALHVLLNEVQEAELGRVSGVGDHCVK